MNILDSICANKRLEVARQKEAIPLLYLKNLLTVSNRNSISFKQALANSSSGIIAEFKRRSPSKGWIHPDADIEQIVQGYETSGAAAISVLTDEKFFGGNFHDFKIARQQITQIPLLRKDFIIDEYQVYQSKVIGADVILLIAACLTQEEVIRLTALAHELDLEVLLEIHNEEELTFIHPSVDVVGINNRDLKTFVTDIRHTIALAHQIPDNYLKISESGISDPQTVSDLRKEGFQGFLMGENFMKTAEPWKALRLFISDLSPQRRGIKVCGTKDPENIAALSQLPIDMTGLIFYEKSPRYAGSSDPAVWQILPPSIRKVGVFVNETKENIQKRIQEYRLQMIQLHGDESPVFCKEIRALGVQVIKAFPIEETEDLKKTVFYEQACDYFLFDTKTPQYGGSGKKFNWQLLGAYSGTTPFFLSGGIDSEDAESIRQLNMPLLHAIDLNSRFEIRPGVKDIAKITSFISNL
jgi:indole-3-glycerol phosphate synthase